jgi:hypothetical protein
MSVDAVGDSEEKVSLDLEETTQDFFSDQIHTVAKYCIEPFWILEQKLHSCILPLHPGEYGQTQSKIQEVCRRVFIAIFLTPWMLSSIPFAVLGMSLTGIGNMLKSREYRYMGGDYQGEFSSKVKVLSLNTGMLPGALPCKYGGLSPANMRFDQLVDTVRENNPDFVFLCEFHRGLSMSMVNALRDRYNHFAIDVGLNAKGLEACFFIAYRGELASPPVFVPFNEKRKGMHSGFFIVETPDSYFICSHLKPHDDQSQLTQLNQIMHFVETECKEKRVVLMGDFNFERETALHKMLLEKGFIDRLTKKDETCTNALEVHMHNLDEEVISESIDYMLVLDREKKKTEIDLNLLATYDQDEHLHEALSDHKALFGVLA